MDPSNGNAKSNIESEVLGFRARSMYLATSLMMRLLMPCLPFPVRSQVRSPGVSSVFSLFPKSNDPPTPLHASMALSLVSVNVNGLRDADKRLTLLQWLSHLSPSVVCLQETHALSSDKLSVWFWRFGDENLLHNKQDLNKQFRGSEGML